MPNVPSNSSVAPQPIADLSPQHDAVTKDLMKATEDIEDPEPQYRGGGDVIQQSPLVKPVDEDVL